MVLCIFFYLYHFRRSRSYERERDRTKSSRSRRGHGGGSSSGASSSNATVGDRPIVTDADLEGKSFLFHIDACVLNEYVNLINYEYR